MLPAETTPKPRVVRRPELVVPRPAADRSEGRAAPWAAREAERRGVLRALPEEPRADEEVVLRAAGRLAVPWAAREAERRGVLRALPEEPRADEEVALRAAAGRPGRLAAPWAAREAERRGALRALPEEPRADEEVALRAADRSEEQPARVGARPLAFLRSPSSPHVFLYRGLSSCNAQARSRYAVQARG